MSPDKQLFEEENKENSSSSSSSQPTERKEIGKETQKTVIESNPKKQLAFLFQPETTILNQSRTLLPPISPTKNYTLVLDLDETLIHFEDNGVGKSRFLIRPFAKNFIYEVSKYFEVVIFTAAL